jgi:hypothetical protein
MEYDLGEVRPDIALLDALGKAIAVIEVVVSHAPEQKTLKYYQSNKIPVALYLLQSDEDLSRLNSSVLEPDLLELCKNPKCSKCDQHLSKKRWQIWEAECSKCHTSMKAAFLCGEAGYVDLPTLSEAKIANLRGCNMQFSRKKGYPGNVCRNCGAFNWVNRGPDILEEVDIGYYCPHCS